MLTRGAPPEACAVALATLPQMGPARLLALARSFGFAGAWERVIAQDAHGHEAVGTAMGPRRDELARQWSSIASRIDPTAVLDAHLAAGMEVAALGSQPYPAILASDIDPPPVLFWRGDLEVLRARRAAIVGTRRCTRGGRQIALDLGEELAAAGVGVVSGLALGIDGAGHEGSLRAQPGGAAPIGVVGSGLDVVYPPRHRVLWQEVADRGVLLSEAPLGAEPLAWRFPARNRIIAALSEVVVVVESHQNGGAMHTVEEALRRDRLVMAVPGSVRVPAAAGTNALIHDGASPARDATDVLVGLGLCAPSAPPRRERRRELAPPDAALLSQLGSGPVSLDALALALGSPLGELAVSLRRLEAQGLISQSGAWVEVVGEP